MNRVLSLSHISYTYHTLQGETTAIKNISFHVEQGEFLAIVGPSGCGKSTLLHIIAGLLEPSSGTILMNGMPLSQGETDIGYMLQKDHLLEHRTIHKNILLGLEIRKKINPQTLNSVDSMLKEYGLTDFRNAYPRQLSGGMRQRAALIRTLALSPNLLLLDEPFSALDFQTRLKAANDIGSILKKQRITAILVTHDLSEAVSMADRVLILSKRPGTIKKIVPIHFAKTPSSPEEARSMPEFMNYFNLIWKEIKNEE